MKINAHLRPGFTDNVQNQHRRPGFDKYSLSSPYWFIGPTHPLYGPSTYSLAQPLVTFCRADILYSKTGRMNILQELST